MESSSRIYRVLSFFDLYDILIKGRLRFSKLSTMQDLNEGLGWILRGQEDATFRQAFIDAEQIPEHHSAVLENHYVSCWTSEPESMAMWSLYSPDSNSIRVATTVGKLKGALATLNSKYSWTKSMELPGTREHVSWYERIEPVEYVDFVQKRDEILTKYRAFRQMVTEKASSQPDYYGAADGFQRDWARLLEGRVINDDGLFLKDSAFSHEKEIRACLYCGVRNEMSVDEWKKDENIHRQLYGHARKGELPDMIFGHVDSGFIDEVCFDPRMPTFKREAYQEILKERLPEVVKSRCFGALLTQFDFSSDFDGYRNG